MSFDAYIDQIPHLLEQIRSKQSDVVRLAGAMVVETLRGSGIIHTLERALAHDRRRSLFPRRRLGSRQCHSDRRLSFLDGAFESTRAEREEGYARALIERGQIAPEDNSIMIEAARLRLQSGHPAPVFLSANLTTASDETIAWLNRPFRASAVWTNL